VIYAAPLSLEKREWVKEEKVGFENQEG